VFINPFPKFRRCARPRQSWPGHVPVIGQYLPYDPPGGAANDLTGSYRYHDRKGLVMRGHGNDTTG